MVRLALLLVCLPAILADPEPQRRPLPSVRKRNALERQVDIEVFSLNSETILQSKTLGPIFHTGMSKMNVIYTLQ